MVHLRAFVGNLAATVRTTQRNGCNDDDDDDVDGRSALGKKNNTAFIGEQIELQAMRFNYLFSLSSSLAGGISSL